MSGPCFQPSNTDEQERCVSDVFQEVEEEYRRQQLAKLWE